MRQRGLRWLHRHGHLDDVALHVLDSSEHARGWSVDASVTIQGLAPNAAREAVTASAGPAGATLQLLERARRDMGLPEPAAATAAETDPPSPLSNVRRAAARCWALLLVRIYECLPLRCSKCGEPMRIIAFVLDRPVIERILEHIGEPTQPPIVLPARSPPQLAFGFDQAPATAEWPEMDQTAGRTDGWE